MPPPGGFEAIKYKRNLPFRGPGALAILGGVAAISAFGFYRYGQGVLEMRYVRQIYLAWSAGRETCFLLHVARQKTCYHLLDPADLSVCLSGFSLYRSVLNWLSALFTESFIEKKHGRASI